MKKYHEVPVIILLVLTLTLACNLPGNVPQDSTVAETETPATEAPVETALPAITEVVQVPTNTALPADIDFKIDCSALDVSKQESCDTFIAQTRDVVYPIYRELTGTSLSTCYKDVTYTIFPGDSVASGAGGLTDGNNIQYVAQYSVDLPHNYDTHELLHTFAACNHALDGHIFHGVLMNAVYSRLGVSEPGYFIARDNPADLNSALVEMVKTSSGEDLYSQCRGILANHLILGYFDLGEAPMIEMYKATMNPTPTTPPSKTIADMWGASASQVEVVLEQLDTLKYPLDVPSCGY
ncbi:MAG: hypothetical protein HYU84_12555 [Chloroflexi bacterium]|nr:hypothetical protein [Chloroflexota bacterium]